MAIDASAAEESARDDLVDRLRVHDVHYIGGGSQWRGAASPYRSPAEAPAARLIGNLAVSADARLRDAIVALLLRHPAYTPDALEAARLVTGRRRLLVEASIVAAAALQSTWVFSLDLYMPGWQRIDADALAARLAVPLSREDYGRPALEALSDELNSGEPFAVDHVGAWEDVARHVLDDLREEALTHAPA